MRVHVLDDWFDTLRRLPSFSRLAGHEVTVWTSHVADEGLLATRLADAEAVVLFRERTRVTEGLLGLLPRLQVISARGAWPHVDVAACARSGVTFCSAQAQEMPNHAAAELTWALILAGMRDLPRQMASLKSGHWQAGVGRSLHGRTLGLYGGGRIGRQVAGYARAFGMNVIWWGSAARRAELAAAGETVPESRPAFFAGADVISLHLRLVSATRSIVCAADLAAMRPGALFVNTARAELIAPGALLEGLKQGRPAMAALDVFEDEPLTNPDDALISHPRVIATPHIGFVTEDELDLQFTDIYDQINAFAAGRPVNVVTR